MAHFFSGLSSIPQVCSVALDGNYTSQTWENSLCLLLQAAVGINKLQNIRQYNEII